MCWWTRLTWRMICWDEGRRRIFLIGRVAPPRLHLYSEDAGPLAQLDRALPSEGGCQVRG